MTALVVDVDRLAGDEDHRADVVSEGKQHTSVGGGVRDTVDDDVGAVADRLREVFFVITI